MAGEEKKKLTRMIIVHDFNQEQNGIPYFSSIVRQWKNNRLRQERFWDPEIMLPW